MGLSLVLPTSVGMLLSSSVGPLSVRVWNTRRLSEFMPPTQPSSSMYMPPAITVSAGVAVWSS